MYGELFYAARFSLDWTQTQVARELKISQSALSKIEANRLEPSATHLLWLTQKLLQVDLIALFDVALAPARLKIEEAARTRDHKEGSHKKASVEGCPICRNIREKEKVEAAREAEAQVKLTASLKKALPTAVPA